MQEIGGLWVRAIEGAHISPKMWGLWVTDQTISKNVGSLGDSSPENRGSLEPYIRVTSIMGVPPGTNLLTFYKTTNQMNLFNNVIILLQVFILRVVEWVALIGFLFGVCHY